MATYFMTWDFNTKSDFLQAKEWQAMSARGEVISDYWSTGVRTNMDVGSTLLLYRQGRLPRGIIGFGVSTSSPTRRQRHDDTGRDGNYVNVQWYSVFVEPIIQESDVPVRFHGMLGGGWIVEDNLALRLQEDYQKNRPRNDEEIQATLNADSTLSHTERDALIKARRGQGVFRENVKKFEMSCRVTGVAEQGLLRASHIKPWRACENGDERLDGNNGLFLTPNVDHLFDRGMISFEDDGKMLVSSALALDDLRRLGLEEGQSVGAFTAEQCRYLSYHRKNVFMS